MAVAPCCRRLRVLSLLCAGDEGARALCFCACESGRVEKMVETVEHGAHFFFDQSEESKHMSTDVVFL